jgi:type I restriction enzyme S subunit
MEVREAKASYAELSELPGDAMPLGYQQTEVGVVPKDWRVMQAGELQPFVTSGSRGWASFYSDTGAPFIRITNLARDCIYFDLQDLRFVRLDESAREGRRTQLQTGDVLISITADIGIVGYVTSLVPKPAYINQHIALMRFDGSRICSKYVSYFWAAENSQRIFRAMTDSGAKAGMNLTTVKQILLAVPPTHVEQEAIAEALSDADALIESLQQLIAKKRQIKQGAMQALLTGNRRLPGFEGGDWLSQTIGDVAPLQRGFDLPTSQLRLGRFPVVYSNGVLAHHTEFQVKGPGVVTGRSGTIGTVTFVDGDFWPHNTSLWVTSFRGNDPKFAFYLYTHLGFERFATGSGVPTLNRNDVHAFKVRIPFNKGEQTAIATILTDMDTELAELETRLAKSRQLKQGMMQELLTGRIRLVSPKNPQA